MHRRDCSVAREYTRKPPPLQTALPRAIVIVLNRGPIVPRPHHHRLNSAVRFGSAAEVALNSFIVTRTLAHALCELRMFLPSCRRKNPQPCHQYARSAIICPHTSPVLTAVPSAVLSLPRPSNKLLFRNWLYEYNLYPYALPSTDYTHAI